ncbi:MAG: 5-formyltetrahydrofolate cyclo-ligase [Lachnospiraceae bacterium]|nr:5-formyltetrahydrofolate cyclo-ligase [Lachnospiraceae bacterium]
MEKNTETKNDTGKASFRRSAIRIRDMIDPGERSSASKKIADNLMKSGTLDEADHIALYASYKSEVITDDIASILLKEGKRLYYPLCITENGDNLLKFFGVDDTETQLCEGYRGIREPDTEKCREVCRDVPEVILVPGVAFGRDLYRMGYGKGFYDRYLLDNNVLKIGLAYEKQLFETVPHDRYDIKLDLIVTEERIYG